MIPVDRRFYVLLASLAVATALLFVLSLGLGQVWIDPRLLIASWGSPDTAEAIILAEIRLPRALLALFIGAILGLSGAVLQGFLRNPLAEPGLLGISATASLGAVLAIYGGLTAFHPYALPLAALTGVLLAVLLLQTLVGRSGDILTIILAGVALSSLAAALTSLALNLSTNPFAALEIVFWMLGSLADRSMVHVGLALPFIIVGGGLLFMTGRALDALSLGADVAQSLGVSITLTRLLAIFGTAIGVGAATAVSGAIGFVGLIVSHLLRPLVGQKPSRLLPASALGGAVFLLAADILVRIIMPERDLKLGVVTAVLGAPFFLWLLLSLRRRSA
ncbi:iron complex transport system permease protein [Roseibium hamelinense]|uniref:Iron complex transport system permease protein n=1 Tax=Roseibium hamelinense TaxID=150831 RepID=A0A562SNS2_9HYPH|nr:iron ABC transporter permease [Roseibium hamelinense]MTI44272.1 iron ABC transporter permease [Roseibium hamelinense]TWI82955.1 iron complex transport system permease protein [Roseibium hamelinense]